MRTSICVFIQIASPLNKRNTAQSLFATTETTLSVDDLPVIKVDITSAVDIAENVLAHPDKNKHRKRINIRISDMLPHLTHVAFFLLLEEQCPLSHLPLSSLHSHPLLTRISQ